MVLIWGAPFVLCILLCSWINLARRSAHGSQTKMRIPDSDLDFVPESWKQYVVDASEVGHGSFGTVFRFDVVCPPRTKATSFAVKRIPLDEDLEVLEREILALRDIQKYLAVQSQDNDTEDFSPFVLSLVADPKYDTEQNHLLLATSFYNNVNFNKVVRARSQQDLFGGKKAMYGFALHVAKGLQAVHAAGWVHSDVKGDNIMISCEDPSSVSVGNCHAAVIDFGLACRREFSDCPKGVGSPLYMAPEVLSRPEEGATPDPKTDVWALGMLLWEIRFGKNNLPSQAVDLRAFVRKVRTIDYENKDIGGLDHEPILKELLQGMLTKSIDRRWDMSMVQSKLEMLAPDDMKAKRTFASTVSEAGCLSIPAGVDRVEEKVDEEELVDEKLTEGVVELSSHMRAEVAATPIHMQLNRTQETN